MNIQGTTYRRTRKDFKSKRGVFWEDHILKGQIEVCQPIS